MIFLIIKNSPVEILKRSTSHHLSKEIFLGSSYPLVVLSKQILFSIAIEPQIVTVFKIVQLTW